ncbi:MAG: hypothetical protein NC906_09145 [Candidatus Omnitrophica bacterium]|nr:hypothetical protein [Candidatus Omnitrophota bacterium]
MENNKENQHGMSLIVQNTARSIKGLIFLFGIYLTISGHITPASGFSGGIVFACVFMLMTLAFGKDMVLRILGKTTAYLFNCFSALLFLLMAYLGVIFGNGFFDNFMKKMFPSSDGFSAGLIPLYNTVVSLFIGAGLFMVFIIFAVRRVIEINGKRILISTEFFDISKKGKN